MGDIIYTLTIAEWLVDSTGFKSTSNGEGLTVINLTLQN